MRPRHRVVAALTLAGVLLAACGSSGGDETADTTTAGGAATTVAGGSTATTVQTSAQTTPTDTGKPKVGGKLTMAQEAENATGWSPQFSQTPIAGWNVQRQLYDPLTIVGIDGKAHPFLAESLTPSADFTSWTIKARAGIKFHDGTDFNGQSIKNNIEAARCSPLVATAMGEFGGCPSTFDPAKPEDPKTNRKPLSTIYKAITVTDPMSVKIDLAFPYPSLDMSMATTLGFMAADANLKDPANGPKNPIGTGPFKFKEWIVNDHMTVVRNPTYWGKDADGTQLPYLDEIVFKPIDDIAAREEALRSGAVDLLMTSNGDAIAKFRAEKDDWSIFETDLGGETNYYLVNEFPTYKGKPNPLADPDFRKGLALGINYEEFNKLRNGGVTKVANGPFPPGTDGYLDDTGYPKYNEAEAKKLIDAYKAKNNITGDVEIAFGTTADPFNRGSNELTASYWKKIGVNAVIDQTEQGQYITRALVGDFQVFGWRNHGSLEPDRGFVWWHSSMAIDPPGVAINFGRIKDKAIDDALIKIRTTPTKEDRDAAAKALNKALAASTHNMWLNWTLWQFVGDKKIQNLGGAPIAPDGTKAATTMGRAMNWLVTTWIKE
jgi:peptide/nickel transport system substrate-binding protein